MKTTVDFYQFLNAFERAGRGSQFSRAALTALFAHLEQYEEDTGEELELDVVALCCDYAEYGSAIEAASAYGLECCPSEWDADYPGLDFSKEEEERALEWLQAHTTVIEFDGGLIIQQF